MNRATFFGTRGMNASENWSTYWKQQNWITETQSRVQPRTIPHTGSVIYVDASKADDTGNGLTPETAKKTITAGYNAAADGGILQLADGTYLMSAEAGGYVLLNTATKGVLIRGNATDNTKVIISQDSGAVGYGIRMRDCKEIDFKDLTLKSIGTGGTLATTSDYNQKTMICENCIIESNAASGTHYCFSKGEVSIDNDSDFQYDFVNCTFKQAHGITFLTTGGLKNIMLFKNCNFVLTGASIQAQVAWTGKIAMYDCIINQDADALIAQFGEDTGIPANTLGYLDLRGNIFTMAAGHVGHGLLLGRGTKKSYVVNNQIYLPSVNDALSIGIALKSTPDNVGDNYIAGNYVQAPRPFYIKGGSKNTVKFNAFVCNEDNWESFGFVNWINGADESLSRDNVVTDNKLSARKYGINAYVSTGESEDVLVTIKTNNINHNYYCLPGKYLKAKTTEYEWSAKAAFWDASTNENTSRLVSTTQIPITLPT